MSGRGLGLGGDPLVRGNRSCDNGDDLWLSPSGAAVIDENNEICDEGTGAAASIGGSDLVPGVDFVTEEVEPGVYRVVNRWLPGPASSGPRRT